MDIIGITGGIGSGKSTVSVYVAQRGFKIIDADKIARSLLNIGEYAYKKTVEFFGDGILNPDNSIDRKKLGSIVFSCEEKRKILNEITHGEVRKKILKEIKEYEEKEEVIFLDIPLLFEVGMDELCDQVWLIVADEEIKIQRLLKRDKITRREIVEKFKSQMSDEEKMARADFVIDNSKKEEALYLQVDKLLEKYEKEKRY